MAIQRINAQTALTETGWRSDICVEISDCGMIAAVGPRIQGVDLEVDILLPALSNLHSHAFQRVLAGLVEHKGDTSAEDDFWTWRSAMYGSIDRLEPEHVQAIAAQAQMEMLEAGFAAVGEFHYIHHDRGGVEFDDPAVMSKRIMAAASDSGIGLTHLPVLYMRAGVEDGALEGPQLRFGCSEPAFGRLIESARSAIAQCPDDFRLGIAPHSLRAVPKEGLEFALELAPDAPIHIHVAEQIAEVEAVERAYGARPVRWLLNNFAVDQRWCLVHATHMDASETVDLAQSGAVAGICPLTEANLGDGIFEGATFLQANGAFGIGSDSNFRIAVSEELRAFEYSQRLGSRRRLVLAEPGKSVGRTLYDRAAQGGSQALGRNAGSIAVGKLADLVALNSDNAFLYGLRGDAILDCWLFAADDRLVSDVWSAGRHMVHGGVHLHRERIFETFKAAVDQLRDNA